MAWFNREDVSDSIEEPSISPDTQPTMFERLRSQSWFTWAARGAAAIVIILIVLFGARSLHHHLNNSKTGVKVATGGNSPLPAQPGASAKSQKNSKSTPSTNSNSSSNSTSTNGSGSSSNSGKSPGTATLTPAPTQVPNTGPGDVVAVFLASAAIAGALHYRLQVRRQN